MIERSIPCHVTTGISDAKLPIAEDWSAVELGFIQFVQLTPSSLHTRNSAAVPDPLTELPDLIWIGATMSSP